MKVPVLLLWCGMFSHDCSYITLLIGQQVLVMCHAKSLLEAEACTSFCKDKTAIFSLLFWM